jgi:hypothetical protein
MLNNCAIKYYSLNSASIYLVNGLRHNTTKAKTNIQAKNCTSDDEVRAISIVKYIKKPTLNNSQAVPKIFFTVACIVVSSIKFINNLFYFSTYMIQKILQTINTKKRVYA